VTFPDLILEALKKEGWEIYRNEDPEIDWTPERGYLLEKTSPSGDQVFIVVTEDCTLEDIRREQQCFDEERYVLDRIGDSLVSVDMIKEYQKDAEKIKTMIERLYWVVWNTLSTTCTMTIWVNEKMIPMEVIRMIEVLQSTLAWWYPFFDGVNGTVIYERIKLSTAMRLAKALDREFRLCPVEYEIETVSEEDEE